VSGGVAYGLALPVGQWPSVEKPSWAEISAQVRRAEELGFDTVWTADEIVWRDPDGSNPRGFWECLTLTGAVAASRSTIQVGTWVISALQHNPGMVVKAAETLDEITGGRFVLGLGSGHPAGGANAFRFPQDKTVSRYAEALEIIVPLLRGQTVTFNGAFHHATDAEVLPRGPSSGAIPLMLGGLSPRTMALAATHVDLWSAFARESSLPGVFQEMIEQLDRICEDVGRDPATLERSIGVIVEAGEAGEARRAEANDLGVAISGSTGQITETLASFANIGVTRVEILPYPHTLDTLDQLAPVMAALV
jgi:alkanesulfonate monooxygenase SsuD/methylene tetrahydromethanopterin reductase-like flavin-dependent oxidoreductase (luciferase family)